MFGEVRLSAIRLFLVLAFTVLLCSCAIHPSLLVVISRLFFLPSSVHFCSFSLWRRDRKSQKVGGRIHQMVRGKHGRTDRSIPPPLTMPVQARSQGFCVFFCSAGVFLTKEHPGRRAVFRIGLLVSQTRNEAPVGPHLSCGTVNGRGSSGMCATETRDRFLPVFLRPRTCLPAFLPACLLGGLRSVLWLKLNLRRKPDPGDNGGAGCACSGPATFVFLFWVAAMRGAGPFADVPPPSPPPLVRLVQQRTRTSDGCSLPALCCVGRWLRL